MEDWGEICLTKIDSGDFWRIIDELIDDNSGFIHNKETILDGFKDNRLYGLRVNETDSMYKNDVFLDKIFCKNSWYLLPCFCMMAKDSDVTVDIMWVHSRARGKGFGREMVKLLNIQYADTPLQSSLGFWERCGVITC